MSGAKLIERHLASKDAEITTLRAQLEEARRKAIEEAAQVAAISASASEDHGDDDGAFMAREIETGIRALLTAPTEERGRG